MSLSNDRIRLSDDPISLSGSSSGTPHHAVCPQRDDLADLSRVVTRHDRAVSSSRCTPFLLTLLTAYSRIATLKLLTRLSGNTGRRREDAASGARHFFWTAESL